jgi:hypothetical protein
MATSALAQHRKGTVSSTSDILADRTVGRSDQFLPAALGCHRDHHVAPSGNPRGMTASAVCSLSLDPLLLLVCLDNRSWTGSRTARAR